MAITQQKIDSNSTGLSIAYETTIGVLPGTPDWYPLDPNSYSDFGAQVTTVARNPINKSRQRKKGFVTDLDASAGFNQDLVQFGLTRHLQGFFFANAREKHTTKPLNGAVQVISGVTAASGYASAGNLGSYAIKHIIKASGFTNTANNGIKVLTTAAAGLIQTNPAPVDEPAPPAAAMIEKVGFEFVASDITFTLNGSLQRMNSAASALLNLGLIPGEWVYIGGDSATNTPTTCKGYARASVITAAYIEFDKVDWVPSADTAATKLVRVWIGTVIRVEEDPAFQVRKTGTLERTLGNAGEGTQAEYVSGACANTLTLNSPQADKVTVDLGFVATDYSTVEGATGVKAGNRPALLVEDAFNTSSDYSRIKISTVDPTNANVTPLFAYFMDLTINISNNVTPNKALGKLGAFDTTAGQFTADGSLTAYFVTPASVAAVRNNSDVTLDIVMAKNNAGMIFDLPLISLGNGILQVEQDQSITVPLDMQAAQSRFGHTMLYMNFPYLPNAAF